MNVNIDDDCTVLDYDAEEFALRTVECDDDELGSDTWFLAAEVGGSGCVEF